MKSFLAAAVVSASVTLTGPATAQPAFTASGSQSETAVGGGEQWGTVSDVIYTASAHDFNHLVGFGPEGPTSGTTGRRTCGAGLCAWAASIHLPSGARIHGVEVSACDDDPTQQLTFWLLRGPRSPGPPVLLVPVSGTGIAATPGCSTFSATLPTPETVANDLSSYHMIVNSTPGINVEWIQYRVFYRLQVSPAPATAAFGDVPVGHPLHRFVEALAASGITGGCGSGNYCPDSPLTRGQMAVFLATALGLHFPN